MLLQDKYLPSFHFSEEHSILINASSQRIFSLVGGNLQFNGSWIIKVLFWLRGMPSSMMSLTGLAKGKFITLKTLPDQEIIIGLIGRFWKPTGDLQHFNPEEFSSLQPNGFAKACWNFRLVPEENGTRLVTETRILCLGEDCHKKFSRYWFIVRPFSGIIRKEILKVVKRQAEED